MTATIFVCFLIWILIGLLVSLLITIPSNFNCYNGNDLEDAIQSYFVYSLLFWPISLFMLLIRVFIWMVINVIKGISKDIIWLVMTVVEGISKDIKNL